MEGKKSVIMRTRKVDDKYSNTGFEWMAEGFMVEK
jgi:hypothetical protein